MSETITAIQEEIQKEDTEKRFKWTKDRILLAIIFVIIILASIALLILNFVKEDFLFNIVKNYIIEPIVGLHIALQVLIFIGIMILQSLIPPIPSEFVLVSGGILFGWGWGSVVGVVGSMFSAAVTYYISKRGGRSLIDAAGEKAGIIDRTILIFDLWINRWGLWAIIAGRAIPFIMFDPVSYAAGLAKIKDAQYFLATFIGSIPRAIFYCWIGKGLDIVNVGPEDVKKFNIYFYILFGVLVFMFILSNVIYYIIERQKEKQTDKEIEDKPVSSEKAKESIIKKIVLSNEVTEEAIEDFRDESNEISDVEEVVEEIIEEQEENESTQELSYK
ncbi:MAG: TVP38/TMEM64 family protein [Asgard group archaeon]|nr:TVP38/TMEM64 family protein [Asgard group archaeon]